MAGNGQSKRDNKDNTQSKDFIRKKLNEEDVISRKRLYNMFNRNSEKLNKLLQEFRNGVKSGVKKNTSCINDLKKEISKLHNKIDNIQSEKKGKEKHREKLGWYLSIVLSIITILSLTGVI